MVFVVVERLVLSNLFITKFERRLMTALFCPNIEYMFSFHATSSVEILKNESPPIPKISPTINAIGPLRLKNPLPFVFFSSVLPIPVYNPPAPSSLSATFSTLSPDCSGDLEAAFSSARRKFSDATPSAPPFEMSLFSTIYYIIYHLC